MSQTKMSAYGVASRISNTVRCTGLCGNMNLFFAAHAWVKKLKDHKIAEREDEITDLSLAGVSQRIGGFDGFKTFGHYKEKFMSKKVGYC